MLEINTSFLRLVGYTSQELVGFTAGQLGLWANLEARDEMVASIKNAGYRINLPVDIRCKSGDIIRMSCSALVLEIEGETHILTLVHALPDSAYTRTTQAQEIAHLDFVESSASIGFWDFDAASGQVRWSFGMESIYGLPKGGFKGTAEDFFSRIHPDDVGMNLKESQAALDQRRPFEIKFRILRPDGSVRWVESRGSVRFGPAGAYIGASGLQIDITDRVARDQEMRIQAQVIESMAEGVVMVRADNATILFVNPRMEQMLGYSRGALEGRHIHEINARTDMDPTEVARFIIAELRAHGHWRGEVKNLTASGQEIWTSCTVSELTHETAGKIWISVHTDINEKRHAQDQRERALSQLQRMSLNYQDSIEAERAAISRDVHDQLGASLTGLRMKLEALSRQLQTRAPELCKDVDKLFAEVRATQIAARDICTRLRPPLLDDVGLTQACRWYLKEWSQQTGIATTSRLSALKTQPDIRIATDMFRVLQELLTNVARHSGAGRVHVTLNGNAAGIRLGVQDDGAGFVPDPNAVGFGLPGVRERVRHHGGALLIDSGAQGSRITASMGWSQPI